MFVKIFTLTALLFGFVSFQAEAQQVTVGQSGVGQSGLAAKVQAMQNTLNVLIAENVKLQQQFNCAQNGEVYDVAISACKSDVDHENKISGLEGRVAALEAEIAALKAAMGSSSSKGTVVAGATCLRGMPGHYDYHVAKFGGASCSMSGSWYGGFNKVRCPAGTSFVKTMHLKNLHYGGEGGVCIKN